MLTDYDVMGAAAAASHRRILDNVTCAKWLDLDGLHKSRDGRSRLAHFVRDARDYRDLKSMSSAALVSIHGGAFGGTTSIDNIALMADWWAWLEEGHVSPGMWVDDRLRCVADALDVPYVMLAALNMVDKTGVWDLPHALLTLQLEYLKEEVEQ